MARDLRELDKKTNRGPKKPKPRRTRFAAKSHVATSRLISGEQTQCVESTARAQRNHIGPALRFEARCFDKGISWAEAKTAIIRDEVGASLARPRVGFPKQRTA